MFVLSITMYFAPEYVLLASLLAHNQYCIFFYSKSNSPSTKMYDVSNNKK